MSLTLLNNIQEIAVTSNSSLTHLSRGSKRYIPLESHCNYISSDNPNGFSLPPGHVESIEIEHRQQTFAFSNLKDIDVVLVFDELSNAILTQPDEKRRETSKGLISSGVKFP